MPTNLFQAYELRQALSKGDGNPIEIVQSYLASHTNIDAGLAKGLRGLQNNESAWETLFAVLATPEEQKQMEYVQKMLIQAHETIPSIDVANYRQSTLIRWATTPDPSLKVGGPSLVLSGAMLSLPSLDKAAYSEIQRKLNASPPQALSIAECNTVRQNLSFLNSPISEKNPTQFDPQLLVQYRNHDKPLQPDDVQAIVAFKKSCGITPENAEYTPEVHEMLLSKLETKLYYLQRTEHRGFTQQIAGPFYHQMSHKETMDVSKFVNLRYDEFDQSFASKNDAYIALHNRQVVFTNLVMDAHDLTFVSRGMSGNMAKAKGEYDNKLTSLKSDLTTMQKDHIPLPPEWEETVRTAVQFAQRANTNIYHDARYEPTDGSESVFAQCNKLIDAVTSKRRR